MLLILVDDEPAGEAPSTLAAPKGGRRMRDSSKNPTSHLCNLLLWKVPTLQLAKLRSSWGYGLWLGRSQTSNAHFVGTRVGIVVARTIRRLPSSEREESRSVVAVRSTRLAGRPAGRRTNRDEASLGETRSYCGSRKFWRPIAGASASALPNPVSNLPEPVAARKAAIIQVVRELSLVVLETCFRRRWCNRRNQR